MEAGPAIADGAMEAAAQRLREGGLVAFPTETVYGLGARADDDAAVAQIFAAKGRPSDHPLIVHVVDADAASAFAADLPADGWARRLMRHAWPGPVSLVVPRRAGMASACAAGAPTIALRCPDHPIAQRLLRRALELGVPGVAAPSANRFGRVSPTRAEHVRSEFGPDLMVLDGGASREGIESAIVDCTGPRPVLLRPGSLDPAQLRRWSGTEDWGVAGAASPRVSGSLESHYAPEHATVTLLPEQDPWGAVHAERARATFEAHELPCERSWVVYARSAPGPDEQPPFVPVSLLDDFSVPPWGWLAMPDNAVAVAHELFSVLRALERRGATRILVHAPPSADAAWDGVRDRLVRAAAPRPHAPSGLPRPLPNRPPNR